jgi:wyosine [tRNA(Phe)-imidazoG37] synthetase (radical SAM superfamily)
MKDPEGYAKLIRKANPTYIEAKAFMHVGYSRLRLGYENIDSTMKSAPSSRGTRSSSRPKAKCGPFRV